MPEQLKRDEKHCCCCYEAKISNQYITECIESIEYRLGSISNKLSDEKLKIGGKEKNNEF